MNLLLDTHILLWWLSDDPALAPAKKTVIANCDNLIVISAASAWEISIKKALGKLTAPDNLALAIAASYFETLSITVEHGMAAGKLPDYHKDPFDRMLIAQAQIENLTVVTEDNLFSLYSIDLL